MSTQITIESFPNELLECILQHLDWYDRQSATLVSRRWASAVFGSGLTTVLKIYMSEETYTELRRGTSMSYQYKEMMEALLVSPRRHKNVLLLWDDYDRSDGALKILSRFSHCVESLKISPLNDLNGVVIDRELSKILKILPNLTQLEINNINIRGDPYNADDDAPVCINLRPMNNLRSLLAGGNFDLTKDQYLLKVVHNFSYVFANLTTLHVMIDDNCFLSDLFRKLSPRLIHLKLYTFHDEPFPFFDEYFPMLETLEVVCMDTYDDISGRHLGRFARNAPKLQTLKLESEAQELQMMEPLQETLQCFSVLIWTLDMSFLQSIEKFRNLEQLELRIETANFGRLTNKSPVLRSVRKLKLEMYYYELPLCEEFSPRVFRKCFPNLTELDLKPEDIDHCSKIADHVPLLRRLVVRYVRADLKWLLELCSKLKLPDLAIYCSKLKKGDWDPSTPANEALSLKKLFIHAERINPAIYKPMLESMPSLKRLELDLKDPCKNKTVKDLLVEFPGCEVVRLFRSK